MVGERNLDALLKTLSPKLVDGIHVFVTLPDNAIPAGLVPRMLFREAEGITLILLKSDAESAGLDHAFPCRMITLQVHSSLDAVGFMARIASELASRGIGVNPVAGFYHDHLFVPDGREDEVLEALQQVAAAAADAG